MERQPIKVFFSYSREDKPLRDKLEKHLSSLKRQGVINSWHDRQIVAGSEWEEEIDRHLRTADIILLLISPDFVASKYGYEIELPEAMARHEAGEAYVIPILLRPVASWKRLPFAKLQVYPSGGLPITQWEDRDTAFVDVAEGIEKTVEKLLENRQERAKAEQIRWEQEEQARLKEQERLAVEQAKHHKEEKARLEELEKLRSEGILLQQEVQGAKEEQKKKGEEQAQKEELEKDQKGDGNPKQEDISFAKLSIIIGLLSAVIVIVLFVALAGETGASSPNSNQYDPPSSQFLVSLSDAYTYNNRGATYSNLGNKEDAIADYDQAIQIKSDYADAYHNRGLAKHSLGNKKEALSDFQKAADFYKKQGNDKLRLKDLDVIENLYVIPANVSFNQGLDQFDSGEKTTAIASFNQAIEINPDFALAYNYRGKAYLDIDNRQAAIADFNQAIKLNPNDALAYYKRGIARSDLGDKQAAIDDYNQAIKLNPNDAPAYNERGRARHALGDKQAAIDDYNQAIKLNPDFAPTYFFRGAARYALGDKQAAIDDYNQAIKLNPDIAPAYFFRGAARYALGDKQAAIDDYTQVIKLNPDIAPVYYSRGNVHYALGDKQAAIDDYTQAIKLNPDDADAYDMRGNARKLSGDKTGAIADFKKAADLYRQQGNDKWLQEALNRLKELQS